jgi:hypothetical protein
MLPQAKRRLKARPRKSCHCRAVIVTVARQRRLAHWLLVRASAPARVEKTTDLQQAVDAIAIEVERLSEGQRFTTKLLAEREREVAQTPPANREG